MPVEPSIPSSSRSAPRPLPPVEAADFDAAEVARRWPTFAGLDDVRAIRAAYTQVFVGQAGHRARDLGRIMAARPVDALLTDALSYGAGLAAERARLPWATFGDTPLAFPDEDTPPFGSGLPPMPGRAGRWRNKAVSVVVRRGVFAGAQRRYQRARSQLGLPRRASTIFEDNLSPYLHLHGATPGFEYPRHELPPQVHWVGPLRPDPPAQWQPPVWWPEVTDARRPVVLVSQGTIRADVTELIVPALRALADVDVTVVVTTGLAHPDSVPAALGGRVPDNARLARFLPYALLLPHVDVFVTNGGYTGVTLALAHGIPIVQAGETEEKADIGARIEWSGVGIRLGTTRPSPAAVRRAVHGCSPSRHTGRLPAACKRRWPRTTPGARAPRCWFGSRGPVGRCFAVHRSGNRPDLVGARPGHQVGGPGRPGGVRRGHVPSSRCRSGNGRGGRGER